jgi:hypothetical protein
LATFKSQLLVFEAMNHLPRNVNVRTRLCLLCLALVSTMGFDAAWGDSGPAAGCRAGSQTEGFWQRLSDSYKGHLFPDAVSSDGAATSSAPAPTGLAKEEAQGYRDDLAPPPVTNPPWPYSVYPEGGTEVIGYENEYHGPLMDAIYCGPHGEAWKDSRIDIYGWFEPGGNVSTSSEPFNKLTGTGGNYPMAYSYESNTVQLDQFALYIERTPDEIQRDQFDWGFRLTGVYGTDYKYTFSDGILSGQYTDEQRLYGFDPVMYYVDLYWPWLLQGENLRIGRYISIPDIEAQLAPNNITYSHSLLYTYDPYTQNGIVSTTQLSRNWKVQLEVSAGNDVGFWVKGQRQPTYAACAMWTSTSGGDTLYPCMNGLNDQKFGWNNVQDATVTWYHKINDSWHMDWEVWYMWENQTPDSLNPQGQAILAQMFPAPQYNIGAPAGAQCNNVQQVYCTSHEWATVNYINYQYDSKNVFTWRTDFLADTTGQRTGFKGDFLELSLGYTHWIGDALEVRPELRWERQLTAPNAGITGFAYDNPCAGPAGVSCEFGGTHDPTMIMGNGGKRDQALIAVDAVFFF